MRFETTYDIPNEYLRLLFKGSFLFSSALLFFFFCFIICFSGVRKKSIERASSKKLHQNSCGLDPMPTPLGWFEHVTSHFQKDKLMSRVVHFSMIWEKTPVDLLFKKIDIGDFNNLRPVSTLLHISKLKERAVFAQPNFHSSSSGLHPMHQSAKT